ncbi:MAG TPA: protein kinase [Ktedonobacteraceae bacterium]
MDDRIGTQLGNYRLLQLLGQGGFADVYLSEHIHLHTQAAIKVLQLRLIENNVQSFLNEARTIAHLVHPYIIRVLDFGVQDDIPFLVMDYAPKGTFRQRFLNGHGQRLPATPLFPYIKQTAAALQYAHDKKLVHRDVKPENMLLGPNDEVLLSDFGFALIQSSTSRSSMEAAGTAAYMAPEQLQGKPRPASDQYALGIIAYEWLTGSCPFQGTFFEIASQHMLADPSSLREKVPSLSPEIESVVMIALAKDPDQRFPTVRDFAIALERACLAAKTVSLDEPLVPPPFLSEPYKPLVTNISSQQPSATFPPLIAGEKNLTRDDGQYPFKPLASAVFQSFQAPTITAHGGTKIKSSSLNNQTSQSSQTHLEPPQAGQARLDPIRRSADWPSNAMPLSELGTQVQLQPSQANADMHNFSQSGIRPLSAEQLSQSSQQSFSQQRNSLSGIRPLPADPNPPSASQGQHLSQSRFSWPAAEQLSQSSQQSFSQQRNSLSGIRSLSPEQFSQSGQNSPSSPKGPATMMNNLQPSLPQNDRQQLMQSQWEQRSDFSSNGAQLRPASKQQSSPQAKLGTEFKDDLQIYRRNGTPTSMIIFVVVLAIFIIGGGAGLIYWSSNQPSTVQGTNSNEQSQDQANLTATASASLSATAAANATGTALANINPYAIGPSTLMMDDPLSSNNQTTQWQENPQGGCQFTNGSYHASAAPNLLTTCFAMGTTSYTNFTYEIQMIFVKSAPNHTSGGILFRGNNDQHQFYLFEVYASGRYLFQKCNNDANCTVLAGSTVNPPSPAYHPGQANTLAVVAKQNTFTLYINQQPVASQQTDNSSPYTQGMIGVLARGGLLPNNPTEVAYSNIRVWQ